MNSMKPWRWGSFALISGIVLLAACDGENLFDSDQNPFLEPRVSVSAPSGAFAGDTIGISVSASAAVNIQRIDISIRGAVSKDTSVTPSPAAPSASALVKIGLPEFLTDTLIYVQAQAVDAQGRVSKVRADTLVVVGPPSFVGLAGEDSATAGSNYTLTVRAFGSRPITQIQYAVRGATSIDNTISINPPVNDVTRDIIIPVPASPADTVLRIQMIARDVTGFTSGVVEITVPLKFSSANVPTVTTVNVTPNPARPGGTVDVDVTATGVRAISKVTVQFRDAHNADVEVPVSPARNSATVTASTTLPATMADSILRVRVFATDVAGNVSAIVERTVRVSDTAAPTVTSAATPATTSAGRPLQIRISAQDNIGLARIGFAVVNPAGDTVGGTPTLVNTAGRSKDTTFVFTVPSSLTPRTVRVVGIAFDASGRRGTSTGVSVVVADSAAPTITLNTPTPGTTLPLQDSVRVSFRVQDPTGVSSIRIRGQATRVDSLGPTTVVDRFTEKTITFTTPLPRDTVITRYLLATSDTASENVDITVQATDSLGNRAVATQSITVGGPRVEIRNPINGSTVVAGQNLRVTAFALDRATGLDSVKVFITGAQTRTFTVRTSSPDSIVVDSTYTVGAATGVLNISATAWNRNRIAGTSNTVSVTVSNVAAADTAKPALRLSITQPANNRVETDDSITVTVTGGDVGTSGLIRIGIGVIATPDTTSVAVDTLFRVVEFATPQTGNINQTFRFSLIEFEEAAGNPRYGSTDNLRFPRQFTLNVHGFAVDASGNCGATVSTTTQSLACVDALPGQQQPNGRLALNQQGLPLVVTATTGSSIRLTTAGTIADALVDTRFNRLYLSNITANKLEILDLATNTFVATGAAAGGVGLVGSAPWGLAFSANNDTLLVANSGSTTISKVMLPPADPNFLKEVTAVRLFTPNNVLYEAIFTVDVTGLIRFNTLFHDFSDRPQFIAVDADGVVVYSTVPTAAAKSGTLRVVDPNPSALAGDLPEVKILFPSGSTTGLGDRYALANIDSTKVIAGGPSVDDTIVIYDHQAGFPNNPATVIERRGVNVNAMIASMRAAGSDAFVGAGAWQLNEIGMSDTTFVAISKDRTKIGFGEGAVAPNGRVILCCTKTNTPAGLEVGISNVVAVRDLINNANERVLGIGLGNPDASGNMLGVARGSQATYFFDRDLRLQGLFSQGVAGGSGGAALHPDQTGVVESNPLEALAFVATANRTIKILDTVHFYQRGEVPIRDNIAGPLRAVLPSAAENGALANTDPNYILVKLFGVTDGGAVVVVNIRNKDLTQ